MAKKTTINELIIKLDNIGNLDVEQALKESCLLVEGTAREDCNKFNGILSNSIKSKVDGNKGEVGTNLKYAPYVEFGTGILAGTDPQYGGGFAGTGRQTEWSWPANEKQVKKYGRVKRYTKDGKPVYYNASQDKSGQWFMWTKGAHPHPFLQPALDKNKDDILAKFKASISEELKK